MSDNTRESNGASPSANAPGSTVSDKEPDIMVSDVILDIIKKINGDTNQAVTITSVMNTAVEGGLPRLSQSDSYVYASDKMANSYMFGLLPGIISQLILLPTIFPLVLRETVSSHVSLFKFGTKETSDTEIYSVSKVAKEQLSEEYKSPREGRLPKEALEKLCFYLPVENKPEVIKMDPDYMFSYGIYMAALKLAETRKTLQEALAAKEKAAATEEKDRAVRIRASLAELVHARDTALSGAKAQSDKDAIHAIFAEKSALVDPPVKTTTDAANARKMEESVATLLTTDNRVPAVIVIPEGGSSHESLALADMLGNLYFSPYYTSMAIAERQLPRNLRYVPVMIFYRFNDAAGISVPIKAT